MRIGARHVLRDNIAMSVQIPVTTGRSTGQEIPAAYTPRPPSAALTRASGFLAGFTHTLQPYIGCAFGCSYCYVAGSPLHNFHHPRLPWGDYVHPRPGIDRLLARELAHLERRDRLHHASIFMSSSTDPYQGFERKWRLSRACLQVFADFVPGLLLIQTRSPLVESDFDHIAALNGHAWLSLTLETDLEAVRKTITPACPSIARRIETARRARAAGIPVQIAVSPCLPYSDPASFGELLCEIADRVVVDTFTEGDGSAGRRTRRTRLPEQFARAGYGDWQSGVAARALHAWLQPRLGKNLGWSQAGFTALAQCVIAGADPDTMRQCP